MLSCRLVGLSLISCCGVVFAAGLPTVFVPNAGQCDLRVQFEARGPRGTWYFAQDEVVLIAGSDAERRTMRIRFEGANPRPELDAGEPLASTINYLVGEQEDWRTDLPAFGAVVYRELYPGIDARYTPSGSRLKATYVVAPGADPSCIRWRYVGSNAVRVEAAGSLVDAGGEVIEAAPLAWQETDSGRAPIEAQFYVAVDGAVGFVLGSWDATRELWIDPEIVYATPLGGSLPDSAASIAVDRDGFIYVTGTTVSSDFPVENPINAARLSDGFESDIFVAKLDPDRGPGNQLVYATYLGGEHSDSASDIAVDGAGRAYITGFTEAGDFPRLATPGGFRPCGARFDFPRSLEAFLAVLSPAGDAIEYATCLGGSGADSGISVAIDSQGHAYIAGRTESDDFPTKAPSSLPPFQENDPDPDGGEDAFVARINPNETAGESLVYSTYLGGFDLDRATAVAVDESFNAYVAGFTRSVSFPVRNAFDDQHDGASNAFVTKLNAGGTDLVFSTFLGGTDDAEIGEGHCLESASGIAVGSGDPPDVFVTGCTDATDFPAEGGRFRPILGPLQTDQPGDDAFVLSLRGDGSSLVWSSYLGGGSTIEFSSGIALDFADDVYVTGSTTAQLGFPAENAFQSTGAGGFDAFIAKFEGSGRQRVFSSFLGGDRDDQARAVIVDRRANVYVAGFSEGGTFPTVNPHQEFAGNLINDAFIVKIAQPEVMLPPVLFHRADPNANGTTDLSDGVFIFSFLFLGGAGPSCLESADANNSGRVDISDGINILNFLFLGGLSPAPPGSAADPCGPDPDAPGSPGDLGCDTYLICES
jgi:hypothetical protein